MVGIDISDEMIRVAREASNEFSNLNFQVASAEDLPFENSEFTHAFSMESLYYYADMSRALAEIHRVLERRVDCSLRSSTLYQENEPSHQWIEKLQVPVHLLSTAEYHSLFEQAGFVDVQDERILDPAPILDEYTGTSFRSHEDYLQYRAAGSLMLSGRAGK